MWKAIYVYYDYDCGNLIDECTAESLEKLLDKLKEINRTTDIVLAFMYET